ncbi:unnamed protein product [Schistosoma margrebowiei]|uniref:Uncharacterized protein n=1 Tax=Schistosoma margrebowiei TaxID=48269 RepID=A0A3P8E8L5_9TREM|nr:unnamed protein product [Schistosoma margrebowiei]
MSTIKRIRKNTPIDAKPLRRGERNHDPTKFKLIKQCDNN